MGYTSGYAAKKIGKAAAFAVGLGFIILQSFRLLRIPLKLIRMKELRIQAIQTVDTVRLSFLPCGEANWFGSEVWSMDRGDAVDVWQTV
jgi:uncharacterized membrane protein (Fun14 family)